MIQFWIKNSIFNEEDQKKNIDLEKLKESLDQKLKVIQDYVEEKMKIIDELDQVEVVKNVCFNDLKVIDDDGIGKVVSIPDLWLSLAMYLDKTQ